MSDVRPCILIGKFRKWTVTYIDKEDITQVLEFDTYEETKAEIDELIRDNRTEDAVVVYAPNTNLTRAEFNDWREE